MSLLAVNNLEKSFGAETLFMGVTFRLAWRQKVGLVGRNGSGKTTLLRLLTGQLEPDKGTIAYTRGIAAGYLRQEDQVDPTRTVLQEAEAAFEHVREMERRLRETEHEMAAAAGAELERVMEEYGVLHDRFDAMGGFDSLRDIPAVLSRLGFGPEDQNKLCGRLSGGEKTRLGIARLLLSGPDILFLDEPTNHLDIEATEWLEGFLKDFGGAVVLVSHDRYFLDRVVGAIAEIDDGRLTLYNGNYTAFRAQKEANRERQLQLYEREQAEIRRSMEFFEKWKNTPSKRSQAQMRARWAERIRKTATRKPTGSGRTARLGFKPAQVSGNEVVILDDVTKRFGERTLFEHVSLLIRRGERVGIVGPNGSGKSTLIRVLLEREMPTDGMARLGANVGVGYFAQDTGDLDLDATVLDNMLDVAEMSPEQARAHLGKFLFTGDQVFRPARMLSGGEKNKLALAQLMFLRPNLLVLDEPTNHLDLESREALVKMLLAFDGTLLLVSHDRYLLDVVATRVIEIAGGELIAYDGNYSQYRKRRTAMRIHAEAAARQRSERRNTPRSPLDSAGRQASLEALLRERPVAAGATTGLNAHQLSKERHRARAAVLASEREVERLEARLNEIEARLAAPTPETNCVALAQEHGGVQAALAEAMSAWERAAKHAESLG
jgi:ATP-binding cassette subfamily F protein 3